MRNTILGLLCTLLAAACGSESATTAPTPTTSSIAVTVASPLKMGATTQATASASLSNGQTEAITSGWKSDAPTVATVTDAGTVSAVSNGRATIYVISAGHQGQQLIRVVPDFQGQWTGLLRVTSCSAVGVFAQLEFCKGIPLGSTSPFTLTVTQAGESVSGRPSYGPIVFQPFSVSIEGDGAAAFSTTYVATTSPLRIDAAWQVNSTVLGSLTGAVTETVRAAGGNGEGRTVEDIVGAVRTSTSSAAR